MGEVADVIDLIDGAEGEIGDEIGEEASEELKAEAEAAQENVSALRKIADYFSEIVLPSLKEGVAFLAKNVAIGAIFYATTVVLKKLSESTGSQSSKQQYKKVHALSLLLKDISETSKVLVNWLKDHKGDTVTLEGIEIALPAIFFKFTVEMNEVSASYFNTLCTACVELFYP